MKAILRMDIEIDDSFFESDEEEELFKNASSDEKLIWLQNKCEWEEMHKQFKLIHYED